VTANFNAVVEEARGEYVLLLAHDDWLGPRYVERCLAVLQTTPGAVLAAGMTRAVRDGEIVRDWAPAHLVHPSGPRRVIDFYASGHSKADFYGMRPRSVHDRVGALHNFWGNDQVFVASLAFTGKLVCVPDVLYHRSAGGLSRDQAGLARAMELPTFQGRHPFATFAWYAATDVLWRSPAYRNLALPGRAALALVGVALYLDRRFGLRGRVRPNVRRYTVRTRLRLYREWRRVMRGPGRRARRRARRGRRQAVKRLRRASRRVARLRRVVVRRLARLVG
jgi:glycosyltransferase involved in cell wall biosynthesis